MGGFMLKENKAVNLKAVAARAGLAPSSVSAILNHTEAARAIPQATKDRVYRAAAELNYRPNFLARCLRTKRTRMVAVLAPGLGRTSVAHVVAAAQRRLHQSGYLLVLASDDGDRMCAQFQPRGIEGVIAIEAKVPEQLNLPVASVRLGYGTPDQIETWLHELGEAAAETIIEQIENEGCSPRLRVERIPTTYAALGSSNPGFSAAEGA